MRAPDGDPQRQQQFIQPSPQPARAQQPQTPHGEVPGSLWLLADTGQRCEVRGVVVLGRAPEASAVNGELGFEVNDPTRSLSRNHARVGRDDQGLWVEDAHSSNGTAIRTPDGQIIAVQPGNRMRIHPGATLLLGDRTVQVSTV